MIAYTNAENWTIWGGFWLMTGIALLYIIKNYLAYEKIKKLKSTITRISKSDHNKANCDDSSNDCASRAFAAKNQIK